jgi:DNA-binding Xre family transcriptional regulator
VIVEIEFGKGKKLNLKTKEEKEIYVENRVREICTIVANNIRWHIECKRMTKKEFSKRTGISKWRLKRILDGNYGGLAIDDLAAMSCEFSGVNDKATRKILTEKYRPHVVEY